ncbi:DUF1353 domain-containing protein [Nocardia shimofusensis]|uniref:DUF1353 domain-containing protein n=1 Tax=Nocardia shimofusensis TaxID=228596 RepID=UPI00082AE6CA|nr:DUF1353 domain-containing protein [Nocardia shimofusensis]
MEITVAEEGGPFYSVVGEDLTCAEWEDDLTLQMVRDLDENGREIFRLLRRIGYRDPLLGAIVVPANLEWTTDFASVPSFLTWLVPKTGSHLPAAILHDGLVLEKDHDDPRPGKDRRDPEREDRRRWGYVAATPITRDQADRIFRDAMIATGTPTLRAWLVWAAVTAATMFHGTQVEWSPLRRWYYFGALCGTAGLIVVLGILSTLDVLGVENIRLGGLAIGVPKVPWIGDGWPGLLGGFAGSVVIPLALGILWGRFRVAGWILGPIAAILLLAVLPIVFLGALYWAAETVYRRHPGLVRVSAVAGVVAAVVVFAIALTGW